MKATFFGILATLVSINANAAMVTCSTVSKVPVAVLSYLVSSSPSQRLLSDVSYASNTGPVVFSSSDLAQYKNSSVELYLLADTGAGIPTFRLLALGSKNKYLGAISEYDSAGRVVKNTVVTCNLN